MKSAGNLSAFTWSAEVVPGYVSGTATVSGSFTYSYNSGTGVKTQTYNNVIVMLNDYADLDGDPHLSGTLFLGGTCWTYYGMSTTYSGSWFTSPSQLTLGGSYTGQATVQLIWQRAGLDFGAIVTANGVEYQLAY